MKHYIRQECAGFILRVLEAAAKTGMMCYLQNVRGVETVFMLVPKLMAMNMDQPEAQLTFGLSNRTSCSKCRWRKGRSAFRKKSSLQSGTAVKRLYVIAHDNTAQLQRAATVKLKHWGFNPTRRSCIHAGICDNVLVRIPGLDEVFPCVDFRDKMHGMFIFFHRMIVESLNYIPISAAHKRIMQQRLVYLQRNYIFRESSSGKNFRKQKNIFSAKNMSAKDKVCMLFLLPHVLGHVADLVPENLRMPLLTALAYAQLLIISVKGRRSYNENELKTIFDNGYIMLFGALESLFGYSQPDDPDAPPAFKRQKRFSSESDTDSTDEECAIGGAGRHSHGQHALTHQHWVMQVVSAGSFDVHNTEGAESHHKLCMRLASFRVRHRSAEQTQASMLQYLSWHLVFESIKALFLPPAAKVKRVNFTCGVRLPLCVNNVPVSMPIATLPFTHIRFQTKLLHRDVLITRGELMDLFCGEVGLPRTRLSYNLLKHLRWSFHKKLIRKDGQVFWAAESDPEGRRRRDILLLKGLEFVNGETNALVCEARCFVTISNVHIITTLPANLRNRSAANNNTLTFLLGRWFAPHPSCPQGIRDSQSRPLCVGALSINHCLWTYASSLHVRRALIKRDGSPTEVFNAQKNLFGQTYAEQQERLNLDSRAYYCLADPDSILSKVNMCPVFIPGTSKPDYTTWLETVTWV